MCNAFAIVKQAHKNLVIMLLLDFALGLTNCRGEAKHGIQFNDNKDLDIEIYNIDFLQTQNASIKSEPIKEHCFGC